MVHSLGEAFQKNCILSLTSKRNQNLFSHVPGVQNRKALPNESKEKTLEDQQIEGSAKKFSHRNRKSLGILASWIVLLIFLNKYVPFHFNEHKYKKMVSS